MDTLKEAFQKIRQDINTLKESLELMIAEMVNINKEINQIKEKNNSIQYLSNPTHPINTPTIQHIFPTNPTHIQHKNNHFKALKPKNTLFSIGNRGVPTDRQTDQQTDRNIDFGSNNATIDQAANILDSLDSVKRDIRLKFKRLTDQEFLVFSTIYQIDGEQGYADYRTISQKLGLTESSIRDYIGRLIKKGIPIEKNKINNKNIRLLISQNLKKIATFQTILNLRDL